MLGQSMRVLYIVSKDTAAPKNDRCKKLAAHFAKAQATIERNGRCLRCCDMQFDFPETGSTRAFDYLDCDEPSDAPTLPAWIHVEFTEFGRSRVLCSEAPHSHHFVPPDCDQKVAAAFTSGGYFFVEATVKSKILNEAARVASDGVAI
jgi:hypothetical protein